MRRAWLLAVMLTCACAAATPVARPKAAAPKEPPKIAAPLPTPPAPVPPPAPADSAQLVPVDPPQRLMSLAATTSSRFVTADKPEELIVRVRISGDRVVMKKRPPVNVALVVDTSGSMAGDGIQQARAASLALLDRLAPGDAFSVVAFGSQAKVLVPSTVISDDVASIRASLEEMAAQGTTDMAGGLTAGLAQARAHFNPRGINRIVFVGDGVPNDQNPILPLARQAGQLGIAISAIGLGVEYDETLMGSMAQSSGGTFHYVDAPARLAAVLDDQVLRLQRTVAKGAWLALTPGPGIVLHEVLGQQAAPNGRGWRVPVGDFGEGQSRDVLVRIGVGAHAAGLTVELMDAVLSYQDPIGDNAAREERAFLAASASAKEDEILAGRDREVEHAAVRMRVADAIVRAVATARNGDLRGARAIVDQASKLAKDGAKTFADAELEAKVKELKELRGSLASLLPPPEPQWGMRPGIPAMAPRAAPSPADARSVRAAHGAAMRELQGL